MVFSNISHRYRMYLSLDFSNRKRIAYEEATFSTCFCVSVLNIFFELLGLFCSPFLNRHINREKQLISQGGFFLKILSNEQLVAAYRDAEKNDQDRDWVKLLKNEIKKRGLNPQ